jgi:internalin A
MTPVSDLTPLVGLPGLQWLDCYNCSLTHIPEGLLNKPSLEKLYFLETKIPGIPAEVLSSSVYDNCLESLRAHLCDLKSGAAAIADAKLMVLGNGLIGKTQICNRLRGEAYNENVSSTHGIVVKSALLPQPNGSQPAQLHLWDFGGQDI